MAPLPIPCPPLGTPVKTRVMGPWGLPGQPFWLDGWGHLLLLFLSVMVTVAVFRSGSSVAASVDEVVCVGWGLVARVTSGASALVPIVSFSPAASSTLFPLL